MEVVMIVNSCKINVNINHTNEIIIAIMNNSENINIYNQ